MRSFFSLGISSSVTLAGSDGGTGATVLTGHPHRAVAACLPVGMAWTVSPGSCGSRNDSLRMFSSCRQALLMNRAESSDTMWRNWATVCDSLPVIVVLPPTL